MFGQLVKSLAELTLQNTNAVNNLRNISSRTLHSGVGACNIPSSLARNNGSLSTGILSLLPTASTSVSTRTYFRAMDEHGRGETAADGYGVTLYSPKDGQRTSLKAVELRFKRLDWGMWIRTRGGRDKKAWKKDTHRLRVREKHVFCVPYHNRRFDRAVASRIKEIRHIPDDPYKVYNDMSWQNYHSLKKKNCELIKKYGSNIYRFPWYRAHFKKQPIFTDKDTSLWYEPPGYHKDIVDGDGVFTPDTSRAQDEPAPNYILEQRGVSKIHRNAERRYFKEIRRCEKHYGKISPMHHLCLPVYGTKLG